MSYGRNYRYEINNNIITNNSNNEFFSEIYLNFLNLIKGERDYHDLVKKLKKTFDYYVNKYKDKIHIHLENPSKSKVGLINLLNDCYIISFFQILIHTPNFLSILKNLNDKKNDSIINNIILVSEYPFDAQRFYKLKQLLGKINPEFFTAMPNDSQEFGIDLLNFLISEQNDNSDFEENSDEIQNYENEENFINEKYKNYNNFISKYQKNLNEIEKLFLFNEINIFSVNGFQKPKFSSNLHIELSLQKKVNHIKIEELLDNKYDKKDHINPNKLIINSKLVSLPNILIISINRILNNENINNCMVLFKENLDLKKYIDYDLFNDYNKKTTYHLYAINQCKKSIKDSHYLSLIKIENKWFIFDEDYVAEDGKLSNLNYSSVVGLFFIRDK